MRRFFRFPATSMAAAAAVTRPMAASATTASAAAAAALPLGATAAVDSLFPVAAPEQLSAHRGLFGFGGSGGNELERLNKEVLKEGNGPTPPNGARVICHYTGWNRLPSGEKGSKFDSSVDRGEKFSFRLGAGEVIRGWDVTLASMKKGEKARVTVPPDMAYGSRGAGGVIGPNATLIFEIELFGW